MSTRVRLQENLKLAMKARDSERVGTLRMVLAAIKDQDIESRGKGKDSTIDESSVLSLLQKLIKQRTESATIYAQANREDLAAQERKEIEIILEYLPQQIEGKALETLIQDLIATHKISSVKEIGKCMQMLHAQYPGQIDSRQASALIREQLQS